MSEPSNLSATELLRAAGAGDRSAVDRMFPLVYDELRRLAAMVRAGRSGETLGATALVHEAYLKLVRSDDLTWNDRAHFLAIAARAMRQVLVDQAARKSTKSRGGSGGGARHDVTLGDSVAEERTLGPEQLLDLDRAIADLAEDNPRAAKVVEFRFFGAMSEEETAAVLEVSLPTVTRDWRYARAWLTRRLSA
jgi:RNA polymerase sigma factor (TIGR02999 family)